MKDPESAELTEKSNLRFFIFKVMVIFVLTSSKFSINFENNSKNKK